MADARDTLLLGFERGLATPPAAGARWLFLNAHALPAAGNALKEVLACEQGFRPAFLDLRKTCWQVEPDRSAESGFDGAMVLVSRSRQFNEAMLSRAWESVKPGGVVLVAGDNNDGAKSLRKFVSRHCGAAESLSKHHAIAFSFRREGEANPFPPPTKPRRGAWEIAPGMFSADGPDEGSLLLADHFNDRIEGDVADFGAGWGYLGSRLLQVAFRIDLLDSIEADFASLQAARTNVATDGSDTRLGFHWLDITSEPAPSRYDWIVMNPPFHEGRAATPSLGVSFILAAARALNPGGRLLMVANRSLPYEEALAAACSSFSILQEQGRFKVIEAIR